MKKKPAIYVFLGFVLLLTSLKASASSVIYTGSISPSTLGNAVTTTLEQFNSALGTLTGVQVTLDFTATPYATVFTFGPPQTFTSSDWASTTYPTSPPNPWTISLGSDSWSLTQPTVTTGTIYGTGQTVPTYPGVLTLLGGTSASADLTAASGLDFASYTGSGVLVFGTSGTGTYTGSGTGLFFGGGADLSGTASVTYTYAPVPEPASLGLAGLGGLSLMLFRRQRK